MTWEEWEEIFKRESKHFQSGWCTSDRAAELILQLICPGNFTKEMQTELANALEGWEAFYHGED